MIEQEEVQEQVLTNIPTPLVVKETTTPYEYLKNLGYTDVEHQGKLIEQMRDKLQLKRSN